MDLGSNYRKFKVFNSGITHFVTYFLEKGIMLGTATDYRCRDGKLKVFNSRIKHFVISFL